MKKTILENIFEYYLSPPRLNGFRNSEAIDKEYLAAEAILFTPADIKTVVQTGARQAIREVNSQGPVLSTESISQVIRQHPRSIRYDMAKEWGQETADELERQDERLSWLEKEIVRAFGKDE